MKCNLSGSRVGNSCCPLTPIVVAMCLLAVPGGIMLYTAIKGLIDGGEDAIATAVISFNCTGVSLLIIVTLVVATFRLRKRTTVEIRKPD